MTKWKLSRKKIESLTLDLGCAGGDGCGAGKELDRYGGFDTSDQGDGDPGSLHRDCSGHRHWWQAAPIVEEPVRANGPEAAAWPVASRGHCGLRPTHVGLVKGWAACTAYLCLLPVKSWGWKEGLYGPQQLLESLRPPPFLPSRLSTGRGGDRGLQPHSTEEQTENCPQTDFLDHPKACSTTWLAFCSVNCTLSSGHSLQITVS